MLSPQYTPPAPPPAHQHPPQLSPREAIQVACELLSRAFRDLGHDPAQRQERAYLGQALIAARRAGERLGRGADEIAIHVDRQVATGDSAMQDRLLDTKAAAELIGNSRRTLEAWRIRGGGPRYVQVSRRCVKYRREDLEAWIHERLRTSTSDDGSQAAGAA